MAPSSSRRSPHASPPPAPSARRLDPARPARRQVLLGLGGLLAAAAVPAAAPGPALTSGQGPAGPVPMAVLGDSNSSSYQDRLVLSDPAQRGGVYRDRTLNWGEVIARLRPAELDPGPWEASGESEARLRWMETLGLPVTRAPRKEDYRYNFANEGADCEQLMATRRRQAPRLVAMMDREPERWRRGVVVIRIGLGNVAPWLDEEAHHPGNPQAQAAVEGCMARFREAVALIRRHHPDTHIVLVGVFEDSHDAMNLGRWQYPEQLARIADLCERWDAGLREIVAAHRHMSFFDDRAWFRRHWGGRDAEGRPAYKTVQVGPLRVTHSLGDAPVHSMLADDHNGLVWNALWAQDMVAHLKTVAGLDVTPIGDAELARFIGGLTGS